MEKLLKHPLLLSGVLLLIGVSVALGTVRMQETQLTKRAALEEAVQVVEALQAFRTLYTSEVVERLKQQGIQPRHDYRDVEGGIPLPATLTHQLGEHIGDKTGVRALLYSEYPFPFRPNGGLRDAFQRGAWEALQRDPGGSSAEFKDDVLRYAVADRMRTSCVACHNTHPQSPKRDWQVGDVRGVLEVQIPLKGGQEQARKMLQALSATFGVLGLLGLAGLGIVFSLLRRSADELEETVTQRTTALRESESLHRAVLENAVQAVVTIDSAGVMQAINSTAERMFGYASEEVVGTNVSRLMPEPFRSEHDGYLANYLQTGEAKIIGTGRDVICQRKDGSTFDANLAVSEVTTGQHRMFTGMLQDITQRKQLERAKAEFFSTVSHELRTPLTAVHGGLGLLAKGAAGELPAKASKLVDLARESSSRLIRLVNDLLYFEKLAAGGIELERVACDPQDLLDSAVKELTPQAAEKEVQLVVEVQTRTRAFADRDRTLQVLVNLISNAIKFTTAGTRVCARATDTPAGRVRFEVQDEGHGIAAANQHKLFQRFIQLDSSDTRQEGGTGLGLAISKAIVSQHGGQIGVESTLGEGSTFWFELPATKAPGPA